MYQTYQGYFRGGRFVPQGAFVIPENTKVLVTVIGDESKAPSHTTRSKQQLEAMERFIAAMKTIDDEPLTDDDFADLENSRVSFNRELDI